MTDRQFVNIIMDIQIHTVLLCAKYPDEEQTIKAYLNDMDFAADSIINLTGYVNTLLSFAEVKEEFETCAELIKIKKKIK